jgi:MHS family shikimate/dehydroshikimate transporter-like MFS transporter
MAIEATMTTAIGSDQQRLRAIRLTAVASLIGTTIEWYDFILYTSLSGLIFNKLFFPCRCCWPMRPSPSAS